MDKEAIKALKESVHFQEFVKYIRQHIESLDRATDIQGASNEQIATEVVARVRAVDTLKVILDPVIDFKDNKNNKDDGYVV
jgi:hypothetical protein|tara:strand:- start:24907 stop:25149 length:243 start_codon:yes stop_codon:yes gene_type:complete